MSFLKKMAGAFIELDETSEQPVIQQPQATKPINGQVQPQMMSSMSPILNTEMVQNLTSISLQRKTAYTAFLDASKKLEAVIPDETTRVKAAFVTISGEGRSLETVLQSIDVHISDVAGELVRFKKTSDDSRRAQVDTLRSNAQVKLQENDNLSQQIASLQQQISQLQTRIQHNATDAQNLQAQAADADAKINTVENDFKAAADSVQTTLVSRKQMLSALLTR